MLQSSWFGRLGTSRKDFFVVFILLFNTFAWYYMTLLVINDFLQTSNVASAEALTIWAVYYLSVVISSVFGAVLFKTRKLQFLYAWMLLGTVSSLLPLLSSVNPHLWSFALGCSLGVGMPVGLAFFADHSAVENRGRVGGIIFLAFYVSAAFFAVAFSLFDSAARSFLFAIWRGAGLLLFVALKPKTITNTKEEKRISFIHVLKDKTLRLYLIPWVMFLLIDRFEGPVLGSYLNSPSLDTAVLLGPIVGSFAALFGGLLADRIGRKRVVIGGFVALGLAYAVVGIAPDMLLSWYLYTVADGIAWGILLVTFLLTLWGDLAQFGGKEKYYVIGGTPYYLTSIIELFVTAYAVQIPAYAAFSLASFFLFLAVLPLLYAPETLPEKKIEARRLKGYIEQARKIREKYPPS